MVIDISAHYPHQWQFVANSITLLANRAEEVGPASRRSSKHLCCLRDPVPQQITHHGFSTR